MHLTQTYILELWVMTIVTCTLHVGFSSVWMTLLLFGGGGVVTFGCDDLFINIKKLNVLPLE